MSHVTLAVALGGLLGCGEPQPERPNLILISLDGMRADRTGVGGNPRLPTPTLDRFAREGVWFERAFSQANESLFSHSALLTGRHVPEIAPADYTTFALPDRAILLGELLATWGYHSAAFVAGGHLHAAYGFDQGFEVYDDRHDFGAFFHKAPEALAWLEQTRAQAPEAPFFLFLHGYDCHRPYLHPGLWYHPYSDGADHAAMDAMLSRRADTERVYAGRYYPAFPLDHFFHAKGDPILDPGGYARIRDWAETHDGVALSQGDIDHLIAHYDGGVLAADLQVGRFLEILQQRGLLEHTLVVLTADHGEDLHDHGYFNHRAVLADATTHVPLAFWGAPLDPAVRGQTRSDLAGAIDVVPTILGLLGLAPPEPLSGRDLFAGEEPDATVVQVGVLPQVSVRTGTHRLTFAGVGAESGLFPAALQAAPLTPEWFTLYDLATDPREQHNAVLEQPGQAAALRRALVAWALSMPRDLAAEPPLIDDQLQRTLRERGYW
ncbi:MAG: sulfatase [Pseudomonadota bacterium]